MKRGNLRWTEEQFAEYHSPQRARAPGAQRSHKPLEAGSTPAPASLTLLTAACQSAKLPPPVAEYRFHPLRKWRFDFAWPAQRIALEVEGGIWTQGRHTRGAGALMDLEKYSEAGILGWRVLYCTPGDLDTLGLDRVLRALTAEGI